MAEYGSTSWYRLIVSLISSDKSLEKLARKACRSSYDLVVSSDPILEGDKLFRPNVRLIIVDHEAVEERMRGWLLDQIRRFARHSTLVYIASHYSEGTERRARAYQAQYYTSKSVDAEQMPRVLWSLLNAAKACEHQQISMLA